MDKIKPEIEIHPIQYHHRPHMRACAPSTTTLRAYEVYSHIYGPQEALITGECRGGFGIGELIAFLYARSFPKEEWRVRFEEALHGMVVP